MPIFSQADAGLLALAGMLVAIAVVTGLAAIAASIRRRRADAASLKAIDFVRSSFASRLARGEPLDELLLQVAEALHDSFKLDAAEIWLHAAGSLTRTVSDPRRAPVTLSLTGPEQSIAANARVSGVAWAKVWLPSLLDGRPESSLRVAPIALSGELLGLIVAERHARAEHLAGEVDVTLEELARELAVGLNKQRLDTALHESLDQLRSQAEELRASRTRIVAAADAERRRIERDLHDGAQQYLVAMAVKVRLIQQLSEADPDRARALTRELTADVQGALDDLRTLAHGIYPPLLSTSGLGEAVAAACRRVSRPVRLEAGRLRRYPPELEAAVYFCCVEALQNVSKYAGNGASSRVRIWEEGGALLFEVADDGAGFDTTQANRGAGVAHMSDRIGAAGGSLRIESTPGKGTRVLGAIPLHEVADEPDRQSRMS
jgi:signal transduction histidine kinase